MKHSHLEHEFVERLPEQLAPGILYVSMTYGTVAHRCCCGCGEEVVTPLGPTDWRMIYDGESVSLLPSVGNWSLPCRSHYVIERGRVIGAGPWSEEQVAAERARDRAAKAQFYGQQPVAAPPQATPQPKPDPAPRPSLWRRFWKAVLGA